MSGEKPQDAGGLSPQYQTYERQKCFIAYTEQAEWSDDLLSACQEVLSRPEFNLEPDYARKHFYPDVPLRQKALELIANARYGIYDLSYWRDEEGEWHLPSNVFIELGMAIALNRPTLLLRHANNRELDLPECLKSVSKHILQFSGQTTLTWALKKRLPQWVNAPPERDWWNRYCIFGGRVCEYREAHPRARQWGQKTLHCHISDGPDVDRDDFRGVVEEVLGRFSEVTFDYLDAPLTPKGHDFLLCTYCQTVRSTPFAVYRITSHSPAETFIAIGMSIALEKQFEYRILKILLTEDVRDVPSLLSGYEVVEARSDKDKKHHLRTFMPTVMQKVRETAWKPRPLPFVHVELAEIEQPSVLTELATEASEVPLVARVTAVFDHLNVTVEREPVSSDSGIDLIVEWNPVGSEIQRFAIQVKQALKPVGVEQIEAFSTWAKSLQPMRPLDEFIVVSESGFTKAVKEREQELDVRLFTLSDLEAWVASKGLSWFEQVRGSVIEPDLSEKLAYLTGGNPLLLALAVDWLQRASPFPELANLDLHSLRDLPPMELARLRQRLESELVRPLMELRSELDRAIIVLSTTPQGLSADELAVLMDLPISDAQRLFDDLSILAFVKRFPSNRVVLHDEMRRLINTHVWPIVDPLGNRRQELEQQLEQIRPQSQEPESMIAYPGQEEYRSLAFVGRDAELAHILNVVHEGNDTRVVFVTGTGGVGKTFLLHELELRLRAEGGLTIGLLDCYNLQTQSISGLQSSIVSLLGARHFQQYLSLLSDYDQLSARQTPDGEMDRVRRRINEQFIEDCNQVARRTRVVLLFDSVELIDGQLLEEYLLDDFALGVQNFVLILAGRLPGSIYHTRPNMSVLELGSFSVEEATEYLRRRLPDD